MELEKKKLNGLVFDGVNLNNYRIFYVVSRTLNYTRASEVLSISQPGITYAIRKLEEELDCKLFERVGKSIKLTKDGEVFDHYITIAFENVFKGMQKINGNEVFVNSTIKIGIPTHLCTYLIPRFIEKFRKRYGETTKFDLISRPSSELLKKLECRELDFIIDQGPIVLDDNLKVVDLLELDTIFYATTEYSRLLEKRKISLKELNKEPIVLLSENNSLSIALKEALDDKGEKLDSCMITSNIQMQSALVKRGLGIGYCNRITILDGLLHKRLIEIPVDFNLPKTRVQLAYNEDFLTKPAYKLIEIIKEEIEEKHIKEDKHIRLIYTDEDIYLRTDGINDIPSFKLNNSDIVFMYNSIYKNIGMDEIHINAGNRLDTNLVELVKELKNYDAKIVLTCGTRHLLDNIELFKYIDKVNITLINEQDSIVSKDVKTLRVKYPLLNIGLNVVLRKDENDSDTDIKNAINFAYQQGACLKLIESTDITKRIASERLKPLIEKLGYKYKKSTARKQIYVFNGHEIILTKKTCSVKNSSYNCHKNNDIYITMDGLIRLCRYRDNSVNIYDEIKNRLESRLLSKIEEACDLLGEGCPFLEKNK